MSGRRVLKNPSNANHPPKDSMIFGLQQLSICLWITTSHRRDWRWSSRTLLHPHCFQNVSDVTRTGYNQCSLRCHQAARFEVTVANARISSFSSSLSHMRLRRSCAMEIILVSSTKMWRFSCQKRKCFTTNEISGTSLHSQNHRTLGDHPDVHTLS